MFISSLLVTTALSFSAYASPSWPHQADVPSQLNAYVRRADSSFSFKPQGVSSSTPPPWNVATYSLTSQTWHGFVWTHTVTVVDVPTFRHNPKNDAAILIITGGVKNAKDEKDAEELSRISGLPVATLYQIPMQPIEGRKEDDLIAHTF